MTLFLLFLLVFMIIGAVIAIETKDLLSSIIALGAVGMGMGIAFLVLKAPDLAITHIAALALCLIILIRAVISRDTETAEENREFFGMAVAVIMLITVFIFGVEILRELPDFGIPLLSHGDARVSRHYLRSGLRETGAANIVTSIILDYRGYDTLAGAAVLFTSIIGALAILRKKSKTNE